MKVVLTQDYKGLGQKGETVEVKDGFALNSLIPQGKAVPSTSGAAKQLTDHKVQAADKKAVQNELLDETIAALNGATFTVTRKANEQGGLYDKFDAAEAVEIIGKERGVELPVETLSGEFPIESTGDHEVVVSHGDVKAAVTVVITSEEE